MSFDDFELRLAPISTGTDGALTICKTAAPIDLSTLITTTSTDGTWNSATYQASISGDMLDFTNISVGVHAFEFITNSCLSNTTVATITIETPSSAGIDGVLSVCRSESIDLFAGLTGNVDLGGVWTNPSNTVVPNGTAIASDIPGQYNFKYVVANGTCPSDSAIVVVVVTGCTIVGLEDVSFTGFNLYPNPSSDVVFIENTGSTEVFNYEILDMNGRVILKANQAINGSSKTKLDLSTVKEGIYLIRVFNDNANKTFRVLKK